MGGSVVKFKPGDLVWIKVNSHSYAHVIRQVPVGEIAGVVEQLDPPEDYWCNMAGYSGSWCCDDKILRPRRDDYQQHEGLGSMDKINRPPDLNEAAIEEMCDFIRSAQKAHEHT
jgi:hypothetical protein